MSAIADNLNSIRARIPADVKLIAVSKLQPNLSITEAYNAGQRYFGENYVQEFIDKKDLLPSDIEWHFIGHLQSNKIKFIAPFVHYVHGVDRASLLFKLDEAAGKSNRTIQCLLQLHVAEEETKHGLSESEALEIANDTSIAELKNVKICGVMAMATFTDNRDQIRKEFVQVKKTFDTLKVLFGESFREISMGMSSDWDIAIEEGSTMIRVGSAIFGERKK
ncbi:MAG: YggS family pyridoxal phosphate-dependent enzyme [Flavobacteriales bacterium]|nr:YggS family pyridoxal phosphate-dependent enzyme [Flavobacteriales bacterium]